MGGTKSHLDEIQARCKQARRNENQPVQWWQYTNDVEYLLRLIILQDDSEHLDEEVILEDGTIGPMVDTINVNITAGRKDDIPITRDELLDFAKAIWDTIVTQDKVAVGSIVRNRRKSDPWISWDL